MDSQALILTIIFLWIILVSKHNLQQTIKWIFKEEGESDDF